MNGQPLCSLLRRERHRTMGVAPPSGRPVRFVPAHPITREFSMKHFLRPTMTAAALAVALGMTAGAHAQAAKGKAAAAPAAAPAAVDKTKASYVVGWDMASQLPPLVRNEID